MQNYEIFSLLEEVIYTKIQTIFILHYRPASDKVIFEKFAMTYASFSDDLTGTVDEHKGRVTFVRFN